MASTGLLHPQVNVGFNVVEDRIYDGMYQLDANDQTRLRTREKIIEVWPNPPPNDLLHVFVSLPRGAPMGSPSISCEYEAAKNLHREMWRNDFSRLLKADKCNGFKYLPATEVQRLQLEVLGCEAGAILFREEYIFTLKRLEERRPNIGGVVVTGQPGIGMTYRHGPYSRTHNMQENLFSYFTYSSISSAWGSPLPYNVINSSTFSLKMVSKCIPAKPPGGIFHLRGNSGLLWIPIQKANSHVDHFNG